MNADEKINLIADCLTAVLDAMQNAQAQLPAERARVKAMRPSALKEYERGLVDGMDECLKALTAAAGRSKLVGAR